MRAKPGRLVRRDNMKIKIEINSVSRGTQHPVRGEDQADMEADINKDIISI